MAVTAGQPLVVIVKNITGSMRVTGHDRDRVELHATETVRGDLQADIDRARAELGLRTESEPGRVAFRVRRLGTNGEAIEDGDCDCRNRWNEDYTVEYDIELRVPRGATLDLATVTDGDVTTEGVSGDFTVANVNGGVRLTGLVGSGSVHTVNGDVEATFERAPAAGDLVSNRQRQARRDVPREPLGRFRVRDDARRRLHRFRSRVADAGADRHP